MRIKFGFIAGLATGYVLGTRASFQQRARVDRAIDKVVDLTVGRAESVAAPEPSTTATATPGATSDAFTGRASA
jgi:hypothetical protein